MDSNFLHLLDDLLQSRLELHEFFLSLSNQLWLDYSFEQVEHAIGVAVKSVADAVSSLFDMRSELL